MSRRVGLLLRRWKQSRCKHGYWIPDPPGWKCGHCDSPAPPGAFSRRNPDGTQTGITYRGEGQA